ncbi:ankyrin repeat-containing domain-containing protein [Ophiocordyceps camponoti-floridani]|uniref:Ankyrin repeat-containing domain-containing protein n=1 Tax=Ophiocordyceps camponoti-floridani TaxID=2030778 RepID=A0A8H4VGB3_9HYPO|nr:ankyrin repeat-containing domain-containing protein [Ophiocordyceps camponoti-floridani]
MGFGRKTSRRGPEISLLSAAFNVPTQRDLKRQAQRRASKKGEAPVRRKWVQPVSEGESSVSSDEPGPSPCTSLDAEKEVEVEESSEDEDEDEDEDDDDDDDDITSDVDDCEASRRMERLGRLEAVGNSKVKAKLKSDKTSSSKARPTRKSKSKPSTTHKSKVKDDKVEAPPDSPPRRHERRATRAAAEETKTTTTFPDSTSPLFFPQVAHPPLQATFPVQHFPYPSHLSNCPFPFPVCQNTAACFVDPSVAFDATHDSYREGTRASAQPALVDLQRIQSELDRVKTKLLAYPEDEHLRDEEKSLQQKLNSALNLATAKPGVGRRPSDDALATATGETEPSAVEEAVIATDAPLPNSPEPEPNKAAHNKHKRRDQSPGQAIRHHLCSGCGEVRSGKFHGKHPMSKCNKPLLNYCSPCKNDKIELGVVMDRHHFCFGCGVVRSKDYQRRHAATVEEPLLPNYCGKCQQEVRDAETIVDVSVVNSDIPSTHSRQSPVSSMRNSHGRGSTPGRSTTYQQPYVEDGDWQSPEPSHHRRTATTTSASDFDAFIRRSRDKTRGRNPHKKTVKFQSSHDSAPRASTRHFVPRGSRPTSSIFLDSSPPLESRSPDSWRSTGRHRRGACGRDSSAFAGWTAFPPPRRSSYCSMDDYEHSPEEAVFPPDLSAIFAGLPSDDVDSWTRSSRGAFAMHADTPEATLRHSSSSTSSSSSSSAATPHSGDDGKHDDFQGRHSASSSSENPYYRPSRFFANMRGFAASPCAAAADVNHDDSVDGGYRGGDDHFVLMPDPIIEEPDSMPSSPEIVKRLLAVAA